MRLCEVVVCAIPPPITTRGRKVTKCGSTAAAPPPTTASHTVHVVYATCTYNPGSKTVSTTTRFVYHMK